MSAQDQDGEQTHTLNRLVFFSDAVIAIVLTLLALELRAPDDMIPGHVFEALAGMGNRFIAFGMSFGVISIFWLAHLSTFRKVRTFDWWATGLNLILLFTIALIPFVSSLIGDDGQRGQAWAVYCAVMVASSVVEVGLVLALTRGKGRLMGGITPAERHHRLMRAASPGVVFGVGLALNLTGYAELGALCWLLFVPVLIIARLIFNWRTRKLPEPAAA